MMIVIADVAILFSNVSRYGEGLEKAQHAEND